MAINNVYNQTPKRIFTNKPFIKGMSYTNADMAPYVCRAISNLDMESSNTATRVRQGVSNRYIRLNTNTNPVSRAILKFYNKYVLLGNTVTLPMYRSALPSDNVRSSVPLMLISEDSGAVYDFYNYIIYNDTRIELVDDTLIHDGLILGSIDSYFVQALQLDDGSIPHTINPNDTSLSFFGMISTKYGSVIYRGLIKIYFHATAKKGIIEIIQPNIVEPNDVMMYGSNILADNPLVYKDHVYFSDAHDGYLEYSMQDSNNVIDITTVQVYDKPVEPVEYSADSKANLVNGFDKEDAEGAVYVRPFPVLPKGNYSAIVTASSTDGSATASYYDFKSKSFSSNPTTEILATEEILNNSASYTNPMYDPNSDTSTQVIPVVLSSDDDFVSGSRLEASIGASVYHSVIRPVDLKHKYTLDDFINNNVGISNKPYQSVLPEVTRVVSQLEIQCQGNNIDVASFTPGSDNPMLLSSNIKLKRHNLFYRANWVSDLDETNTPIKSHSITIDYSKPSVTNINLRGITPEDYAAGILEVYGSKYDDNGWVIDVKDYDDGERACLVWVRPEYSPEYKTLTIRCEVSPETSNTNSKPTYVEVCGTRDAKYPFAYTAEEVSTDEIQAQLGYKLHLQGSLIKANPYISIDASQSPHGVGAIFSAYYSNNGAVGVSSNIDMSWSLHDISSNFGFNATNLNKITVTFPKLTLQKEIVKTSISSNYIKNIQVVNESTGTLSANYNLEIAKSAFKTLPNDRGAVIFNVTIFPTSNDNTYAVSEAVSMPTAIVKTYVDDIIYYDSLSQETNFSAGVNKIAMHLGHYVFWGNETKANTLYYSEFNNPAYIPSMYAINFDKPIVHVHPHQGNLVVFTTDDIYLLHGGNVPSTTAMDGSEIAFTQSLIQSNTRLGYNNANTVVSIGKDVFFISDSGDGYLLKTNRYVSNASDTYVVKITHQIEDLLKDPFEYAKERAIDYGYDIPNTEPQPFEIFECNPIIQPTELELEASGFKCIVIDSSYIKVIDGDTFSVAGTNTTYRLADINTPELSTNERLSLTAKNVLQKMLRGHTVWIYYREGVVDEYYGRQLAWVTTEFLYVNADMVKLGLAELYFENKFSEVLPITSTIGITRHNAAELVKAAAEDAIIHNRGIHNNLAYAAGKFVQGADNKYYKDNYTYGMYTYATNSCINIIQSINVADGKGITIIYKYNIDARTWTTYDFIGAVFPTEVIPDGSRTGFSLLCANEYKEFTNHKVSKLTFVNQFTDYNEVVQYESPVHVYFDTGNQSIAIMNEKLFREFKLSLGATIAGDLDIDYKLRMYVDGVENTGKDKHFRGEQNIVNGFKKITFFAPARGRIPRYTVDITCNSDVNILEYAIVYLQLNAK